MNEWYKEETRQIKKPYVCVTDEFGRNTFCYEPIEEEFDSKNQHSFSVTKAIYRFLFKKDEKQKMPPSTTSEFFEEDYTVKH